MSRQIRPTTTSARGRSVAFRSSSLRLATFVLVLLFTATAASALLCQSHADCDDGQWCNGSESCDPLSEEADHRGCVIGLPPCLSVANCSCNEATDACEGGGIAPYYTCVPWQCQSDAECDDSLWCNGTEQCAPLSPDADQFGCRHLLQGPLDRCGVCTCYEVGDYCGPCSGCDKDGDGHSHFGCTDGDDCDDRDPNRYPGNVEVCDAFGHDEDCDLTTFGQRDEDGDGWTDDGCCNFGPTGDAYCGGDCDDYSAGVNPLVPEVCNGLDDDCDALIDEGLGRVLYLDWDRDGWGVDGGSVRLCDRLPHSAEQVDDCNDLLPSVHPGATEICNGVDDNCNGAIDEGLPQVCP